MTATTLQKSAGYTIPAPSSAHWQIMNSPTIGQAQGLTMRFFIISKTTLKLSGTILSWWRQEKGFLLKYRIMLRFPWNWIQKMRFIQPWLCMGFWPIMRGKFLFPTESLWFSSKNSWWQKPLWDMYTALQENLKKSINEQIQKNVQKYLFP